MIIPGLIPDPASSAGSILPVFGYFSPDSMIPLASILAAAVGVLLLLWSRLAGLVRKLLRRGRREEHASEPAARADSQNETKA